MIQIDALPAFSDNYIWLLQDATQRRCVVVDPGDAAPVLDWLDAHPDWRLSDILITHHHQDHVGGVERLKASTGAKVYGPADESIPGCDRAVRDGERVEALGLTFQVMAVPGHTLGHVAYYHEDPLNPLLFCGDTLFAAGCGRLFEGTAEQMHHSLGRLAALPETTAVYCAHEYTLSNLRFAQAVEPGNPAVAERFADVSALRERGAMSVPSRLAEEKATNPFLRVEEDAVRRKIDEREGVAERTAVEVFRALRGWKDRF
ncbi:hydroxyacylglutathione hydrolase [Pseudomonas sp. RIT-PI-AD]|uniref:hydroxyacylglutathione hydrolase n=1 Tax=Pseudomonas sp. RIT-PI-AD TaxID=3035294 RepID=UPI0021DAFF96|nr:hydroxyacylglutathione hydrolase [Pseudomonas sp. RIT-PI-AD]